MSGPLAPSHRMDHAASDLIHVAVGIMIRPDGKVLLSKRHADAHQGGLWEFPGGKCEPGESIDQALQRELQEELGIDVTQHRPLIRIHHTYPECRVLLDVHKILSWRGKPRNLEGQPLEWVPTDALAGYPMPAADQPVIRAIQLADRYVITPAHIDDQAAFLQKLENALENGLRLLQFRVFGLPDNQYIQLAHQVRERCTAAGTQLMLNTDAQLARQTGSTGLHLNSRQLTDCRTRPAGFTWLGASCHTTQDLQQAQKIGADFALLSPVLPTRSHPDAEPLGWARFAEMVDTARLPVYALGGMHHALMQRAWNAGAQGIAGIRGFWSA